jgi:hypothetical protein
MVDVSVKQAKELLNKLSQLLDTDGIFINNGDIDEVKLNSVFDAYCKTNPLIKNFTPLSGDGWDEMASVELVDGTMIMLRPEPIGGELEWHIEDI